MQRLPLLLTLSVGLGVSVNASALDSAGLTLETGSPDALCPELATAREVVARRLGSLVVEGRGGWRARYTIAHAPSGKPRDFVRLELFNPDGGLELSRDLPMEGESCRTMAEVIALVLDRHFRGLDTGNGNGDDVAPDVVEDAPRARAEPAKSAAEHGDESASSLLEPGPTPQAPRRTPLRVSAPQRPATRLALEIADALPAAQPSIGVRALFPIYRSVSAGAALSLALLRAEQRVGSDGSAHANAAGARGFFAWAHEVDSFLMYVGPGVAVSIERGTTSGLLDKAQSFRAIWSVGIDAGLHLALNRHLFLGWTSTFDVRIPGASGRFYVDGDEVLAPRSFRWGWGVGLGYAFSP